MAQVTEETVREALMQVKDPELGFDIVALGLVYGIDVDQDQVHVRMTLTNPACAAGPAIVDEVKKTTLAVEGVADAEVELVWEPMWTEDKMSAELKQMREWGIYG